MYVTAVVALTVLVRVPGAHRARSSGTDVSPGTHASYIPNVTRFVCTAVLCVLLLVPGSAVAAHHGATIAPPGDSATSQYLETVPAAGGARPPGTGATGASGAPGAGALSNSARQHLLAQGADGSLLAGLVAATAPPVSGAGATAAGGSLPGEPGIVRAAPGARTGSAASRSGAGRHVAGQDPLSAVTGQSPTSFILAAATGGDGGGGLGIFLPGLLLAAVIAAVVRVISGRRPRIGS